MAAEKELVFFSMNNWEMVIDRKTMKLVSQRVIFQKSLYYIWNI